MKANHFIFQPDQTCVISFILSSLHNRFTIKTGAKRVCIESKKVHKPKARKIQGGYTTTEIGDFFVRV